MVEKEDLWGPIRLVAGFSILLGGVDFLNPTVHALEVSILQVTDPILRALAHPILQAAEVQNIRVAVVPNLLAAEDPILLGEEDPNLQEAEDLGLVDKSRTEALRHPAGGFLTPWFRQDELLAS